MTLYDKLRDDEFDLMVLSKEDRRKILELVEKSERMTQPMYQEQKAVALRDLREALRSIRGDS